MPSVPDHVDLDELKAEQARLAKHVRIEDDLPEGIRTIAGFDASYDREGRGYGALVVLDAEDLEPDWQETVAMDIELPYVPGLLAYRELPLARALWAKLDTPPDLLVVDGGGLIHPRRLGSACHLGVEFEVPSIGVTKSLLLGEVEEDVRVIGDRAPVHDDGELVGYALLSSERAKNPIYVSPGHRVTAKRALELVEGMCLGEHKAPEPIWWADRLAGKLKRSS